MTGVQCGSDSGNVCGQIWVRQPAREGREGLVASPPAPVNPHPVGRLRDLRLGLLYTHCTEDIDRLLNLAGGGGG